jgi:hypothetical protein
MSVFRVYHLFGSLNSNATEMEGFHTSALRYVTLRMSFDTAHVCTKFQTDGLKTGKWAAELGRNKPLTV